MVETVTINTAAEHVEPSLEAQAAAAGIDVGSVDSTATEQTADSKILGKFKSQEDLIKAYQALEQKLGKGEAEAKPVSEEAPVTEEEPKEEESTSETQPDDEKSAEEQAKEAVEEAGLNFDELSNKYWETGTIEEADYASLEKAGISRSMVDQFIEGQKAIVELEQSRVHNSVGGKDAYQSMIEWAKGSLSEAEVNAYDRAVNSDNMDDVLSAVKGLKARFDNENGFEPVRRVGGSTSGSAAPAYESLAQMQADMRNPLYYTDPAFRAQVEQKLARSSIL